MLIIKINEKIFYLKFFFLKQITRRLINNKLFNKVYVDYLKFILVGSLIHNKNTCIEFLNEKIGNNAKFKIYLYKKLINV